MELGLFVLTIIHLQFKPVIFWTGNTANEACPVNSCFLIMISDEMITKYQELVKKRFNREVSRSEALEQGTRLSRLVELVFKPMSETEFKLVQKHRKETEYY